MDTFIAVCLGLIVLELGIFMGVGVYVFLKVKRAAEAVEVSAYKMEHRVEQTLSNGWVGTAFKAGAALAGHFMGR